MARHNGYHEKSNPLLTVLYVLVALLLIAALLFMYKIHRERREEYENLVRQAAENEKVMELEARAQAIAEDEAEGMEEAVEDAQEALPELVVSFETAVPEPTEAPVIETAAPEVTQPPVESAAPAGDTGLPELSVPDDALIDDDFNPFE